MALEKNVVVLMDGVDELGCIRVKRVTRIIEDGVILSETYHRHVLEPGDSLAAENPLVRNIAQLVHTPAVIQACVDRRAAARAKEGL